MGLNFCTKALVWVRSCVSSSRQENNPKKHDRGTISVSSGSLLVLVSLIYLSSAATAAAGWAPPHLQSEGGVEGIVSTIDSRPVGGASVTLVGAATVRRPRVYSGVDGSFGFSGLTPGSYEIVVVAEGFSPLTEVVEVMSNQVSRVDLNLTVASLTETITVTAGRTAQRLGDVPSQVAVLTHEDIKRSAALTVDDLLRQVPSFSLFRRTSSLATHPTAQGVSLRGIGASGVSRTLVLLDGIPHNDHFGNWVYWSKIPQSQIETVEIAEGGLSTLYGSSAMAGVVNIVTRKPEPGSVSIKGQAGMRGTGDLDMFASHQLGTVGMSGGGSLFRTGGYKMVREEERGPIDTEFASRHATGNWRVDYSPNSNLTLFQNGRFFDEDRDNGTPLRENSTDETYLGGGLRALTPDGSDWQLNVFSHIQTFRSSFTSVRPDRASEAVALLQDVPSKDFGLNGQWSRRLPGNQRLTAGADFRWIRAINEEEVFITGGPREGFNIRDRRIVGKQIYSGLFFHDSITPTRRLVLVFGGRVDHWENFGASRVETLNITDPRTTETGFMDTDETTVTPRAGVSYHLTDNFTLRSSFYQGFRAPTLNELYRPFRVGSVQTNANENLTPERLIGTEAGFNHTINRKLFWRMTGFWNRLKDPVSNITISQTDDLITRQRQNLGRARIGGVDAQIVYHPEPNWRVRGQYLYSDAVIENFAIRPEIEGNRLPQVPKHRATLAVDYLGSKWAKMSVQGRFESLRFDDDRNQIPLGSFFVTDLTLFRPLTDQWEAFFAVENLFNRRYPVQASGVELLGTPIMVTGGLRFNISPR